MISYYSQESKKFALFYSQRLSDIKAEKILAAVKINSAGDAEVISRFFWRMVEQSIADRSNGEIHGWEAGIEKLTEELYSSFGGAIEKAGFEEIWDAEIDKQ